MHIERMLRATAAATCGGTLALLGLAGCDRGQAQRVIVNDTISAVTASTGDRRIAWEATWDTLLRFATVGDGRERPARVAVTPQHVVFFGEREKALIAVDSTGTERWRVGPLLPSGDSLRAVVDLRPSRGGGVLALDPRSRRLIEVAGSGRVQDEVEIDGTALPSAALQLDGNRRLVLASDTTTPFMVLGARKQPGRFMAFPNPAYAKLHTLARAGILGAGERGEWVFAFQLGDGLVSFRDTMVAGPLGAYAERVQFPAVVEEHGSDFRVTRLGRITRAATAAVVLRGETFVLFGGETADKARLVDVYSFPESKYRYSFRLPAKAIDLGVVDGHLVALTASAPRAVVRIADPPVAKVAER